MQIVEIVYFERYGFVDCLKNINKFILLCTGNKLFSNYLDSSLLCTFMRVTNACSKTIPICQADYYYAQQKQAIYRINVVL